jgi:hypothetical protein
VKRRDCGEEAQCVSTTVTLTTPPPGHVLPGPPRLSSPNIVLVERSNWDSDSDLESPSFTYWNNDPPNRFSRRHPRSSRRFGPYGSSGIGSGSQGAKDEYMYTLVCGSEVADCESDHVDPFTPSILPLYPPPSPSAQPAKRQQRKVPDVAPSFICMLLPSQGLECGQPKHLLLKQ